ncbi:MAG: S8 family serine peptidase [Candidatus Omnitrophica bacterium]|nr:S8 family serine peptidase [Candidatus Omnitrophota bacterium]
MSGKHHSKFLLLIAVVFLLPNFVEAKEEKNITVLGKDQPNYVADSILVRFKPDAPGLLKQSARNQVGAKGIRSFTLVPMLERWKIGGMSVEKALSILNKLPFIEYAEPDYLISLDPDEDIPVPNDMFFDHLWGMHNFGQAVPLYGGYPGLEDADIDAPQAWKLFSGIGVPEENQIIIGVIDTGIDPGHPDLADNIWVNPGEIPGNGLDDDGNGYVDDIYGWDFANNDNDPDDDHSHGTHVAGTIGAIGYNAIGVAGVIWECKLMALKFLNASGYGATSDAILALQYAVDNGAKISNNSWGGSVYSQTLSEALTYAQAQGHLFVAAAGNSNINVDSYPFYPACYSHDNVISVAATDKYDNRASFSNYGVTSVDIGAPGVEIASALPVGMNDPHVDYGYKSGTSMACPHVTGVAALIWARQPQLLYKGVKDILLRNVRTIDALAGKTATGGGVNAFNSISEAINEYAPPIAQDDLYETTEGITLTANPGVLENDSSGLNNFESGGLNKVIVLTPPSYGVLALNPDGTFNYTPNPGFIGTDSFTYKATDSYSETNEASAAIRVTPAPDVILSEIDMSIETILRRYSSAEAIVSVLDEGGNGVDGASVSGLWKYKGSVIKLESDSTVSGKITFTSPTKRAKSGDTFEFVITDVSKDGFEWDESQSETAEIISVQ